MGTQNATGVYQRKDGYWEYRFTLTINGKKVPRRKSTDVLGNKLKTKKDAIVARENAMVALRQEKTQKPKPARRTVREVFEEFCVTGRKDRAYQTIRKQDSLWENHLAVRFAERYVDEISVGEVNDYLAELYYENELAYRYVESFLKMFYLIFGQAYSRGYLDVDIYNMLCINKNTKIHMPKIKSEDDTDIIAFSRVQLALLDDYFRGTNAETAYLLGRYCGLRINECFGLKWENVDLENGTIFIDRQMMYQEGLIKLVPPKTRNSKRTIQQIIVSIADEQLIGADNVPYALSPLYLLVYVADRMLQILETDFFGLVAFAAQPSAHRIVNHGDVVQYALIIRFHAVCQKSVMAYPLRLRLTDKITNDLHQTLRLSLVHKFCGIYALSQQAHIVQVEVTLTHIEALAMSVIHNGFQIVLGIALQHGLGLIQRTIFLHHQ